MAGHAKVLLVLVLLVAGGLLAWQLTQEKPQAPATPPPTPVGPPANAVFLDMGPSALLAIASARRPGDRAAVEQEYGKWVPQSGWEGEVTSVETERGVQVIRMFFGAMSAMTEYWVVVRMQAPVQVEKNQRIWVQGQLVAVEKRVLMGNVLSEVTLDQGRLLAP
jgi:hypothetical protein